MSYNVLTRVDARRAYETGQVSFEQMLEILQDQGYDTVNAHRLGGFYRETRIQQFVRVPEANSWVKEGFDLALLKRVLVDRGMREEFWEDVQERLQARRSLQIQRECIANVKKRFLNGTQDEQAARNRLLTLHLPEERISDLLNEWSCVKSTVPKPETAQQVCKLVKQGLVSEDGGANLLRRLGYTSIQARRIVQMCKGAPAVGGRAAKREKQAAAMVAAGPQ